MEHPVSGFFVLRIYLDKKKTDKKKTTHIKKGPSDTFVFAAYNSGGRLVDVVLPV